MGQYWAGTGPMLPASGTIHISNKMKYILTNKYKIKMHHQKITNETMTKKTILCCRRADTLRPGEV